MKRTGSSKFLSEMNDLVRMTSMAAANGNVMTAVGFFPSVTSLIPKRSNKFCVAAAMGSNNPSVDMTGKKVNGVYVDKSQSPYLGKMDAGLILDRTKTYAAQTNLVGTFVEDRKAYRQTFVIRSYEIGPDQTATMETFMNLLQETALNHVRSSGLAGNGFGATVEMTLRNLIWVVTRIHLQVHRYSCWGDVVEIDTWVDAAGKNAMRRDWIIRDYNTQEIIAKATSTWVVMNNKTRRLSKIPEQVREELLPFYTNRVAIPIEDDDVIRINRLTDETAETVHSGLAPRWNDMDANQHVNNVKYIGWILESVPTEVIEDFSLTSMTLEYRRECRQANFLESLTSATTAGVHNNSGNRKAEKELTHLLRMQDEKTEIVRARTEWQPKIFK